MNIYKNIEDLPTFTNACITIGSFDGVHKGHLKVIDQLIEKAKKLDGTSVVITFYPHPRQVISKEKNNLLQLSTFEEKCFLLQNAGIDNLVIIPFTKEFSEKSAMDYINQFLVEHFHPKAIVIGYDHKFGKNRTGDISLLKSLSAIHKYEVEEISEHLLKEITVSSSAIRDKISSGEIKTANELLGYTYSFSGNVIKGNQLGRTIGFPTANISVDLSHKLIPAMGVYAVSANIPSLNKSFKGMMNIGNRPTLDGKSLTIEVNLFDFNQDIYDSKMEIFVKDKIRNEIKFNNINELKEQLIKDKETALELLLD